MKYAILVLYFISFKAMAAVASEDGAYLADTEYRGAPAALRILTEEDLAKLVYVKDGFVRSSPAALARKEEKRIVRKYLSSKKSKKFRSTYLTIKTVHEKEHFEYALREALFKYAYKNFHMDLMDIPLLRMQNLIIKRLKQSFLRHLKRSHSRL